MFYKNHISILGRIVYSSPECAEAIRLISCAADKMEEDSKTASDDREFFVETEDVECEDGYFALEFLLDYNGKESYPSLIETLDELGQCFQKPRTKHVDTFVVIRTNDTDGKVETTTYGNVEASVVPYADYINVFPDVKFELPKKIAVSIAMEKMAWYEFIGEKVNMSEFEFDDDDGAEKNNEVYEACDEIIRKIVNVASNVLGGKSVSPKEVADCYNADYKKVVTFSVDMGDNDDPEKIIQLQQEILNDFKTMDENAEVSVMAASDDALPVNMGYPVVLHYHRDPEVTGPIAAVQVCEYSPIRPLFEEE